MLKHLWKVFCFFGVVLVGASRIAPEEATSNIAKWFELIGMATVSISLDSPMTDFWSLVLGLIIIIISIVSFFLCKSGRCDGMEHNEWLKNGVYWVAFKKWSFDDTKKNNLLKFYEKGGVAWDEIRQAASEGEIVIWGKEDPSKTLIKIPSDFWKTHSLGCSGFNTEMAKRPEELRTSAEGDVGYWGKFGDLKITKKEFEEIWPKSKFLYWINKNLNELWF